jgi:hypothetical protein
VAQNGLGDVTRVARADDIERERAHQTGVSLTPSKTKPYWACPRGLCEAIVDPPAQKVRGRWRLPGEAQALEGGGELGGYDPTDLQSAYNIPVSGGEKQQHYEESQTIAVVDAFYDPSAESDLAVYRQHYGLAPCTIANGCFRQVNEQGEVGHPPTVTFGEWELETSLDLDMASATCPHCHLLLVETSEESLGNFAEAEDTAARLGATAISNSYGAPENNEAFCGATDCTQYNAAYNHPGVVITVSAGDAGYDSFFRGATAPNFPASSPNVIAVGGTSLRRVESSSGRKWSEAVWFETARNEGTGSGCAVAQPKPLWQADKGCAHRTDNDVAAVGACATPVSIYTTNTGWFNECGTSASAPIIAGIEAHAGEAGGAVPTADAFYGDRSSLYDVTQGRDTESCSPEYLCSAETQEAGYDGPAGNGTPAQGPVVAGGEAPSARTEPPTAGDTLNGAVDPNGLATTYCFEYGKTTSYGTCVPAGEASAGAGTSAVKVSRVLGGLAPGIYHYRLTATNHDGTSHGEDQKLDTAAPTVTSVTPNSGFNVGGTSVKIVGTNFTGAAAVRFGGTEAADYTVLSETEIEASSPAGSGTVDVTVEDAGGLSAAGSGDRFTYVTLPPPTVTAVTPDLGASTGRTAVIITGSNFVDVTAVKFGSANATRFNVLSEHEIEARSPSGRGTVDVTVTTGAGVSPASTADLFTYEEVEAPSGLPTGWMASESLASGLSLALEPRVAMDAHGDTAAIWSTITALQSAFRPSGGGWQAAVNLPIPAEDAPFAPRIAFDPQGEAFAAWGLDSVSGEVVQASTRPRGGGWQPSVTVSGGCLSQSETEPQLAVDSVGDALIGWRCYVGESAHERVVLHAALRPAGGTWQAPVTLAEEARKPPSEGETLTAPAVVFDSAGNGYAGWYDEAKQETEVASLPAGGSWQPATGIAEGGGPPELAADGHGGVYALVAQRGGLDVAYRPASGSWQPPSLVVAPALPGEFAELSGAQLVVNAEGEQLLIWSGQEASIPHIHVARKPPGGAWRAPVVFPGTVFAPAEPAIALDARGDAIGVWLIGEAEAEEQGVEGARLSGDGGWSSPFVLAGTDTAPQVATTPQGNAVVVWAQVQAGEHTVRATGYDAGPELEALTIPASGTVGSAVSFSVSPDGVWSAPGETKWSFGDGTTARGTSVSHTFTAPGSYEVTVENEDAFGQKNTASGKINITSPVEKAELKNAAAAGSLTLKRSGQVIALPASSTFNGSVEVNAETGSGTVSGALTVSPFTASLKLFGLLPTVLGVSLTQVGSLTGTVAPSKTVAGDEALTLALKLSMRITSVSLLSLQIPTSCSTAEPLSLSLVDNLTREALLRKGWSLSGTTTLSRFKCAGGLLGSLFGGVLTSLLSGPENTFALSVSVP